jgi:hypothetical protein
MLPIDDLRLPPVRVIDGVATFCIAHQPPLYALPDWVCLIDTSGFSAEWNPFQVRAALDKAGITPLDPSFLANDSLLLIEALVQRQKLEIDRVCLLLHRKFVTGEMLGVPSANFPNMRLIAADGVRLTPELLFGGRTFLTSEPRDLPLGVLYQYFHAHVLFDFLHLSEIAVAVGSLRQEDFFEFCQGKLIISGALVGLTPVDLFLRCLEVANALVLHLNEIRFQPAFPEDPYQSRAVSFFLERLMSFELLRGLSAAGVILPFPGGGAVPLRIDAFGSLMTVQTKLHPEGIYEVGYR